jgi:tripartite-type tricarboxylate transporter receptor subunit TctC
MLRTRRAIVLGGLATAVAARAAHSQVSFKDKRITMLISSPPGGGNDTVGRLIGRFLKKHLPGEPEVIIQNMPGANNMLALNHLVHRTPPDGLTIVIVAAQPFEPVMFRHPSARYDPKALAVVGGISRGGMVMVISKEAEPKLYNKSASPAVIGMFDAMPHGGLQSALFAIEYLGWNARWVVGYRGTQDIMLAIDRGEIDMMSTGNLYEIADRLKSGALKIVNQTGRLENGKVLGRQDYGNAPLFPEQIKGKITDPLAQEAYDYWLAQNTLDKVLVMAPGTPAEILQVYRTALDKVFEDPEFQKLGGAVSEGLSWTPAPDVENAIRTLADTMPETLDYFKALMRKQGMHVR